MNRKTKVLLILITLFIVIINLHVWNIVNMFKYHNDTANAIQEDLLKDLNKYENDFDEDDTTDEHPKYQDEEFTAEEIKLFGPLEEREVKDKTIFTNFLSNNQLINITCMIESKKYTNK